MDRAAEHGVDQLLALAGRLPDLGEVMPHVVWVEQPDDIAGPAAHKLRAMHHRVHHVAAAPIVIFGGAYALFIAYVLIKLVAGKFSDIHPAVGILAVLFVIKYLYI